MAMINELTLEIPPILVGGHHQPHGTATAYRDHYRPDGDRSPCEPCMAWHRKAARAYRARKRDERIAANAAETVANNLVAVDPALPGVIGWRWGRT